MRRQSFTAEGVVLKARNYGEADKIYTVLTKELGKTRLLAKGVRKITSRRAGSLDLMNRVRFSAHEGFSIPLITEVLLLNSFDKIKDGLFAISCAYYLFEIVDKILPEEEENEEVFNLILGALRTLSTAEHEEAYRILAYFQFKILTKLGYDPVVDFCGECFREISDVHRGVKLNFGMGSVVCESCHRHGHLLSRGQITFLQKVRSSDYKSTKEILTDEETHSLNSILKSYIEHILEEKLKTQIY